MYPGFVELGDFGGFSGKSPRPGEWMKGMFLGGVLQQMQGSCGGVGDLFDFYGQMGEIKEYQP